MISFFLQRQLFKAQEKVLHLFQRIPNPNFEAKFKLVRTLMQLMPDKPRLRAADEKFILSKPFTTWIVLNF